jgi:tetratricopeptide (TPR) repeat protein
MARHPKVPNLVLRRIREIDRGETRAEFAEALARKAEELGESLYPTERYVARLEDGDVKYPYPAYRRVLTGLCGRSMAGLGFTRRATSSAALASLEAGTTELVIHPAAPYDPFAALQEWPAWFGVRIAHLLALVETWSGPIAEIGALQALVHEEILMFDAAAPRRDDVAHTAHVLARRQALITLAALPTAVATASQFLSTDTRSAGAKRDIFLAQCAASLTACWHLLRGSDLSTVDQVVSAYLLPLEGIARKSSTYQRAAAVLASQAHRIFRIIALHRNTLQVLEQHSKQALYYAKISADSGSQASALISLANTYFYGSQPEQAVAVYEKAYALEPGMSPLLRSRLRAEVSVVYGQVGRVQEALKSVSMAEAAYPELPEQDGSFLYAEFTPASLMLEKGLAYAALAEQLPARGYQRQAADIFEQVGSDGKASTPDRIRFEIANNQARTAVLLDDMDAFEAHLTYGLEGARLLASNQRRREAELAWRRASARWSNERRLRALGNRLELPPGHTDGEESS